MKRLMHLLLSIALLAATAAFAGDDRPNRFDPSRDARADVAAATAQAGAQGKRVLVDVGGEWCAWCHILDRFIASHPDVQRLVNEHYVWVKVNWSPENRNEQLLSRWPKIKGYPHLFVLDGAGRLVRSQSTGELESGKDYDEAKVLAFLQENRQAPR